ncbi:MAG: adenylyltransferase/cytidyltransferase family protein [Planctomycetes bacterium]|nr:adenylyltransferase/cytidyltransferase family protein [Planctomycetota bacterium]
MSDCETSSVRSKLIKDRAELAEVTKKLRAEGKEVVFTNGTFDVLHVGHVRCLEAARGLGDVLIVGLNSDASVRGNKGEGRPLITELERAEILAGLWSVDYITIFSEKTVDCLLELVQPRIYAKGTDYNLDNLPERMTVERLGIKLALTGDPKTHSATELVDELREQGTESRE